MRNNSPVSESSAPGRIRQFERKYGAAALDLACHAALPVALNPELIHLLRINFFLDGPNALPFTAEADLLLSPLCTEIGEGLYEVEAEVRALLQRHLAESYGSERVREVASLLWRYTEQRAPWSGRPTLEQAQKLNALTFLDPDKAQEWLDAAEQSAASSQPLERAWFVAMRREMERSRENVAPRPTLVPQLKTPKVFISYCHYDGEESYRERVLELSQKLRSQYGIDCEIDQYYEDDPPAEGWPRWMYRQIEAADAVLVVCTVTYKRRFEDAEEAVKRQGVRWEGPIITQTLYDEFARNKRFIPIGFTSYPKNEANIPLVLRSTSYRDVTVAANFEQLLRQITGQPSVRREALAPRPISLPPKDGPVTGTIPDLMERARENAKPYHVPPLRRDKVFIGYSHRDARWLARLQTALKPLVRQEVISLWDDTVIQPGERWREKIEEALAAAKVAVLLVSSDFLASDFIARHELPPLLKAAEREGMTIFWVPVTSCLYEVTEIAGFQAVHDPERPLDSLGTAEWKRALTEIVRKIKAAVTAGDLSSGGGAARGLWNVPARNPFFTGRADILRRIGEALEKTGRAALSGLGGMGKTQTAIEYAYRHREEYRTAFWVQAETRDELDAGFATLARLLHLPERDEPDRGVVVAAVWRWLEANAGWLLVLDNANDLDLARAILPSGGNGHVLFTTRAQMMGGLATRIRLPEMEPEDAALLLLRRAEILPEDAPLEAADEADRTAALALSDEMDGLPLALDQAGAYIAATRCGVAGYRSLYARAGDRLRARRSRGGTGDHASVTETFALAFDRMTEPERPDAPDDPDMTSAERAAADLLRLCAFLPPDAIPEKIFTEGAPDLGEHLAQAIADPLLYDAMMGQACRYSLLERDPKTWTLSVHPVVQEVIKDTMDEAARRVWEERAKRVISRDFPAPEPSR